MLRKLTPFWWPRRWHLLAGVAVLLAAIGIEILLPWPAKWLVDYAIGGDTPTPWAARIWPSVAASGKAGVLAGICLVAFGLAVAHRLATYVSQTLLISVGGEMVYQLRCRGYDQFCRLSLAYHDRTRVGDSLYRVAYDTQAAMTLVSGAFVPLLQSSLMVTGILIVIFQMDRSLALVAAAMIPVFWGCIRLSGAKIERASRAYHDNESVLLATVQESLTTMRTLQAFTREPDTALTFQAMAGESRRINLGVVQAQLLFGSSVGLALAAGTAAAMWIGARGVLAGTLSIGDVLVFLSYLALLYQPLNATSQGLSALRSSRAQLERVFEVLDASTAIADRPGAKPIPSVRGEIEFRQVSFEYDNRNRVLDQVAFSVRPGEVVALVGPTGAGKSTLASLLLRFYDPTNGSVLLDGHDLRNLPLGWLRRQVSVVLQDALLVSGTVRDNIAYGCPGASFSEIEDAARQAQAHEFICELPNGYDSALGEHGVNLSGGQKQRLAIARAFLKNAPVLVLDEPTSALDVSTEEALLTALKRLTRGRTTIIIAHRLSTLRLADRIVVLQHGTIAEEGSHDELMRRGSFYSRYWKTQQRSATFTPLTIAARS